MQCQKTSNFNDEKYKWMSVFGHIWTSVVLIVHKYFSYDNYFSFITMIIVLQEERFYLDQISVLKSAESKKGTLIV